MLRRLRQLLETFPLVGISDDSRKVKKGSLFVAIKGERFDGHEFISQAIDNGASVIVCERLPAKKESKISYIRVSNSRRALSLLASLWYGNPTEKMKVIGVTGTDGKTTTATLIYWILKKSGKRVGLISTVAAKIGERQYDTGFHVTNPEPLALQKFLAKMVREKCEYCVLEVTSHGLDQERVYGIDFEVSVLTNITHEHLDYHKTFENYVSAKEKLFLRSKISVLNRDYEKFIKSKGKRLLYDGKTLRGVVKWAALERFPEEYNHSNAAGAITVAKHLGISDKDVVHSIKSFPQIVGRMEEIKNDRGARIIVDFAHTPNGLEEALKALRKQKKGSGKLIAVFGCAGERDKKKRSMMARISSRLADTSVFTAEDPRSEKAEDIISQMLKGAKDKKTKIYQIPERGEAIFFAINDLARRGDTVVICGKGHEKSMAYNGIEYPWSDQEAVREALNGKVKKIER